MTKPELDKMAAEVVERCIRETLQSLDTVCCEKNLLRTKMKAVYTAQTQAREALRCCRDLIGRLTI
jgi:hypothetical protein